MTAAARWRGRSLLRGCFGYFHLLFQTNPSKLDLLLLLVGTLAAIAAGLPFSLLGILFGQLVDDLDSSSCNTSQSIDKSSLQSGIQKKVILMIYIAVGNFVAIYIHAGCWSLFGERLIGRLRRHYFKNLLRQEIAFFDHLPAGEVATRLTSDMETIRIGTSEKVGLFISSSAYLVGAYIVAFLKAPRLAGILTFMIPAYILMVFVGSRYTGRFSARTSYHLAAAASVVSQSLSNVALIHALGANQRLETKFEAILRKARQAAMKKTLAAAAQFGFMFLIAYSANAVAFWQGSREILGATEGGPPSVTAGAVYTVIFVLLDGTLLAPCIRLSQLTNDSVFCDQPSCTLPTDIQYCHSSCKQLEIYRQAQVKSSWIPSFSQGQLDRRWNSCFPKCHLYVFVEARESGTERYYSEVGGGKAYRNYRCIW